MSEGIFGSTRATPASSHKRLWNRRHNHVDTHSSADALHQTLHQNGEQSLVHESRW